MPKHQRTGRKQILIPGKIWFLRQNCFATTVHYRNCPSGYFNARSSPIAQVVADRNATSTLIQGDSHLLLYASRNVRGLYQSDLVLIDNLKLNGQVVRRVTTWIVFGCQPKTMAPPGFPIPKLCRNYGSWDFTQDVLFPEKSIAKDAGTNVSGDD